MKIAINTCFGGFGLSNKAIRRLAELKGRECYFYRNEYTRSAGRRYERAADDDKGFLTAFDAPYPDELSAPDFNIWYSEHSLYSMASSDNRTDPDLIQVIEILGAEANGDYAKLEIISIPDDVEWEIDEYDGIETVHERHRSWG